MIGVGVGMGEERWRWREWGDRSRSRIERLSFMHIKGSRPRSTKAIDLFDGFVLI